jgi:hypothetical protein
MSKLVSKNKQLILESSSELSNIDKDTNEEEEESTDLKDYELKKSIGKFDEEKNCRDENYYSNECNKFLLKKELKETNYFEENPYLNNELYPNLSDTNFNIKIANKKGV